MASSGFEHSIFPARRIILTALAIAYLIGLGVFAYFASVVTNFPGEVAASRWVQTWHAPWADSFMIAFSAFGTTVVGTLTVLIVCVVLYAIRWRFESAAVLLASVAGQVVTYGVKELVARPRPSPEVVRVLQESNRFSFPSNHVMVYTVFIGTLLAILFIKARQTTLTVTLESALALLLLLTGYSRVYLGVHWLGDVIGGYALGVPIVACAVAAWMLFRGNCETAERF